MRIYLVSIYAYVYYTIPIAANISLEKNVLAGRMHSGLFARRYRIRPQLGIPSIPQGNID